MEKKCKVNGKDVLCYEIELVLCKFFEMCIIHQVSKGVTLRLWEKWANSGNDTQLLLE